MPVNRFVALLLALVVLSGPIPQAAGESEPDSPTEHIIVSDMAMPSAGVQGESFRASGAEFWIGIRKADGSVDDAVVSASISCLIFCVVETAAHTVQFHDFNGGGLRADLWGGGRWRNVGFGTDIMTTRAEADHVSLRYNTASFFPMVRLPLWRDATLPGGHVNLYGGLMVTRAWGGEMEVSFPELTRPVSGVVTGTGNGAFAGVMLKYRHVGVGVEYRTMDLDLEMKEYFDYGYTRIKGDEVQLGLSYLY